MKKFIKIIGGLIVVLLLAILIVPNIINWNQYIPMIEDKASTAIGRDVSIMGDVKIKIFPSPSISINDINIANPKGMSGDPFLRVETIRVDTELRPLLKKDINITGLKLINSVVHFQTTDTGANNWTFSPPEKDETATKLTSSDNETNMDIQFDDVGIENARVFYSTPGKPKAYSLDYINAQIDIQTLQGPYIISGTAKYNTLPFKFEFGTDQPNIDNERFIQLNMAAVNNSAYINFKGSYNSSADIGLTGNIESTISNPEALINGLNGPKKPTTLPDLLNSSILIKADVVASDNKKGLNNIDITLDDFTLSGQAVYNADENIDITMATKTIRLNNQKADNAAQSTNDRQQITTTINESLKNAHGLIQSIIGTPLPNTGNITLTLGVDELILKTGATVNNASVTAKATPSAANITNISAQLPGNASIKGSAKLTLSDKKISGLNSTLTIQAPNVRKTMNAFDIKDMPDGLSPLLLKTNFSANQNDMAINDTVFNFGDNNIKGLLMKYSPQQTTPVQLAITGGIINFNNIKNNGDEKNDNTSNVLSSRSPSIGLPASVNQMIDNLNAQFNLALDQVIYGETLARNITLNGALSDQSLIIEKASIGDLGDFNSLTIALNGKIGSLHPIDNIDMTLKLGSDNLSRTLWSFGNKNAADLGRSKMITTLKGGQSNAVIKADGTIDKGVFSAQGDIKNIATLPQFIGSIQLNHPESSAILRNFMGMDVSNRSMGAFSLSSQLTASPNQFKAEQLKAVIGDQGTLQGNMNLDQTTSPHTININITADTLPLGSITGASTDRLGGGQGSTAAPKTWSQDPIDLSMLNQSNGTINVSINRLIYDKIILDNLTLSATLKNGTTSFENFGANIFGGNFNVTGTLNAAATGQAHNGNFNININQANVEKIFNALGNKNFGGGTIDWTQKLSFSGADQLAIVKSLNGQGNVSITNGVVNGINLDGLAEKLDRPNSPSDFLAIIQQASAGGTTAFDTITAPIVIQNGIIQSNDIVLASDKSRIDLDGTVHLPKQILNMNGAITFPDQPKFPPLGITISGPLYAPKKSFNTDNILRFYTQRATQEIGGKITEQLFGKKPVNDSTEDSPNGNNVTNSETQQAPEQDVEDVLKQEGERLIRGLLGQ